MRDASSPVHLVPYMNKVDSTHQGRGQIEIQILGVITDEIQFRVDFQINLSVLRPHTRLLCRDERSTNRPLTLHHNLGFILNTGPIQEHLARSGSNLELICQSNRPC